MTNDHWRNLINWLRLMNPAGLVLILVCILVALATVMWS